MHTDTLAARDEAQDRVGRRRPAAFGELRHQRVDADHQHPAAGRLSGLRGTLDQRCFALRLGRFGGTQQHFDVAQRELVLADDLEQGIGRVEPEPFGQVHQVDRGPALALQQLLHRLAATRDRLVGGERIEPGAHLGLGAMAREEAQFGVEPVARRPAFLGGCHLDCLAVLERRVQRHHHPVDTGAPATVPERGVHAVGEVHRSRTLGQFDDGCVGRQHVDAVVEDASALLTRQVALPGQQLAQHRDLRVVLAAGRNARVTLCACFLVGPVRRHAMFRMVVHGLRPDLDLDRQVGAVAHHAVQRLVAIDLRPGDVVVELVGNRREMAMHIGQRLIAIRDRLHDDAQPSDVVHLLEAQRLAAHLLDDAVDVLGTAMHRGLDALGLQARLELRAQLLDPTLAFGALLVEHARDLPVGVGLGETERQVLQLPLDLPDAQAVGQRREHLQGFTRQAGRHRQLAGRVVAQGLQARSQAQHHDAQVARKRQQHLADVFGLRRSRLRHRGRWRIAVLRGTRTALYANQLGRLHREPGQVVAETLGNHLLRLGQVLTGVNQVGGGLHRLRPADGLQDAAYRVRVHQRVFAGVERLAGDQRLGERACACQRKRAVRCLLLSRRGDLRQRGRRVFAADALHTMR